MFTEKLYKKAHFKRDQDVFIVYRCGLNHCFSVKKIKLQLKLITKKINFIILFSCWYPCARHCTWLNKKKKQLNIS